MTTPLSATSEEARLVVDGARRLRAEVLEPLERELDLLDDPDAVAVRPDAVAALDRALEMGLHRVAVPERFGGLGAPFGLALLALEELAAGAPAFAGRLAHDNVVRTVLAGFAEGPDAQRLRDALDATEPAAGGLAVAFLQPRDGAEGAVRLPGSGLGVRTTRYRTGQQPASGVVERTAGGGLRLRDVALRTVAGADGASRLLLLVGSPGEDPAAVASWVLDLDRDGVVRQPRTRLTGLRAWPRADLLLGDVSLAPGGQAVAPADAGRLLEALVAAAATATAATAIGLASRAYDHAFEYCCTRVQGGKPIIQHESIAAVLWHSSYLLATVRQAVHGATATADGVPDLRLAASLWAAATDMVLRVTVDSLELLGGYGVTTEYPLEKLHRDARTLTVTSGLLEGAGVHGRVWLP